MAEKRICSIQDCSNPVEARGYCKKHYTRWHRTGSATIHDKRGELLAFLQKAITEYESDECLIWPFGKHSRGYGVIRLNGGSVTTHRYVCEQVHGRAPEGMPHAAHSCGDTRCINPRHLRWATPTENSYDALRHGTRVVGETHWKAKLSDQQVAEIRALGGKLRQKDIAKIYGASRSAISSILSGKKRAPNS